MDISYIKALHIIFVVTWFAGLFYIVRLFVYHHEANELNENSKTILINQYKIMEKRLWYGITWPSMIFTVIFGVWMIVLIPGYLKMGWMMLKLAFVYGLLIYHFVCHKMFNDLQNDKVRYTSQKMRLWNEVATIFLVAIVFIVVTKSLTNWFYGLIGLIIFTIILMAAIKVYKKIRGNK